MMMHMDNSLFKWWQQDDDEQWQHLFSRMQC
jgi:hypothetical protein